MSKNADEVIVVGIDGSDSSTVALKWAAAEAHLRGASLHLVQAYSVPMGYAGPGAMIPADLYDGARDWASASVDRARSAARAVDPELTFTTTLSMEPPLTALREASKHASLTVVGSHGMGVVSETLLGSVAMRVATHAHSPVVVIRTDPHDPPALPAGPHAPVMVGIDGSAESEIALAFALQEASLRGVGLVAVRTWDEEPLKGFLRAYPLEVDHSVIDEQERVLLADQLAGWVDKYPQVEVVQVVRRGRPAGALIRSAAELRPGLLVVGSRGRGGFTGMLLGSTSHELIAYADGPVAVVRGDHS